MRAHFAAPTPLTYRIDSPRRRIAIDILDLADSPRSITDARGIRAAPVYNETFDVVVDCRRLRGLPDPAIVWMLGDIWMELSSGSRRRQRWAILTTSPGAYSIAGMLTTLTHSEDGWIRAFQHIESALEWLDGLRWTDPHARKWSSLRPGLETPPTRPATRPSFPP